MTVFMAATALLVLLLLGFVLNHGIAVVRKMRLQQEADDVAVAAGQEQARAMNELTALQHLVGEELGWVSVVDSISGPGAGPQDLEPADRKRAEELSGGIASLASQLQERGQETPAAIPMGQPIESGATTGQGKVRLRAALVADYQRRLAGGPDGTTAELAILREWQALTELEVQARQSREAREVLMGRELPGLLRKLDDQVQAQGAAVAQMAGELGRPMGLVTGLWPTLPELPVRAEVPDLAAADAVQSFGDSQVVQSAWPWVLYDRQPVRDRFAPLAIADAGGLHDRWSVVATARAARELYIRAGRALYVLKDSIPGQKGFEPWTTDSRLADRHFALLALACQAEAGSLAAKIFPRPTPSAQAGHAQPMLFNRNPQVPPGGDPRLQPRVGWDTLNWSVPVARFPSLTPVVEPAAEPGWDARLMPVTLLDRMVEDLGELDEPLRRAFQGIGPVPRDFQNH
jgi:hypothetical protein